jgi:hypothetical protein
MVHSIRNLFVFACEENPDKETTTGTVFYHLTYYLK